MRYECDKCGRGVEKYGTTCDECIKHQNDIDLEFTISLTKEELEVTHRQLKTLLEGVAEDRALHHVLTELSAAIWELY